MIRQLLTFLIASCCIFVQLSADSDQLPSQRKMKILMLIIACDNHSTYPNPYYPNNIENNPVFPELQKNWRAYMHSDPEHVEAYFLKSDPNLPSEYEIREDTIWVRQYETWIPGILNKTVIGMEALLPRLDEFDYVVRTNLSSFYIYPRLLDYLETLPREKCYCGMPYDYAGYLFVQGAGIILSTDLVRQIVENKYHLLNQSTIDDALLGIFLFHRGIGMMHVNPHRLDIPSLDHWESIKNHFPENVFHIRTKNEYGRRIPDEPYVQDQLIKIFYKDCVSTD